MIIFFDRMCWTNYWEICNLTNINFESRPTTSSTVKSTRLIGKYFTNFIPATWLKANALRKCAVCSKNEIHKESQYWYSILCATVCEKINWISYILKNFSRLWILAFCWNFVIFYNNNLFNNELLIFWHKNICHHRFASILL